MGTTRFPRRRRDRARHLRREETRHERLLWGKLRANRLGGLHFRRQAPLGPFVVDFLCHAATLVVELDGGGHTAAATERSDRTRDRFLAREGFAVLRFWNDEVLRNLDGVTETILATASARLGAHALPRIPPSLASFSPTEPSARGAALDMDGPAPAVGDPR